MTVHTEATSKTKWIASLSCGLTVFDDDQRIQGLSAWHRLRNFLRDNNLSIVQLRGQYGTITVDTAYKAHGYFFSRRVIAALGLPIPEMESWGVGHILNHKAYIKWIDNYGVSQEIRDLNKEILNNAYIIN